MLHVGNIYLKPDVGRWSIHGAHGHLQNKRKYGKLSKNARAPGDSKWLFYPQTLEVTNNLNNLWVRVTFSPSQKGHQQNCQDFRCSRNCSENNSGSFTKTIPRGKCCWYGMLPQWTTYAPPIRNWINQSFISIRSAFLTLGKSEQHSPIDYRMTPNGDLRS